MKIIHTIHHTGSYACEYFTNQSALYRAINQFLEWGQGCTPLGENPRIFHVLLPSKIFLANIVKSFAQTCFNHTQFGVIMVDEISTGIGKRTFLKVNHLLGCCSRGTAVVSTIVGAIARAATFIALLIISPLRALLFDHSPDSPLTAGWYHPKEHSPIANAIRQWIQTEEAKQILSQITELDLSRCNLFVLPAEIGQLTSLQKLYLEENQLTFLPPEIGQLVSLKNLNIGGNQLTSLPPEIGQLTSLQKLSLWRNQLTSLPAEIGQLSALQELDIGRNQLTSLPPEIGQLASLEKLYLEENQHISLPLEIGQLSALKELTIEENPLTPLPAEIEGLVTYLTYSFRKKSNTLSQE